ncbi:hypothetical protein EWM64_g6911 [Hericium alpestre]|uniref:galacturonan 1,4-alpha-galacturonidase n=1 Tax=Hericium alpestre TaxID=135208 RepID=A0A4Y9ZQP9_9AGAM|nr:hypothetical protein EWM64_g6911 [Hericium alpestre]
MLTLTLLSCFLLPPALAWRTYEVPHTSGQDDTPGLVTALANYIANATILFKRDVTYNIFTPVRFPVLNNVELLLPRRATQEHGNQLCLERSFSLIGPLQTPAGAGSTLTDKQSVIAFGHSDPHPNYDLQSSGGTQTSRPIAPTAGHSARSQAVVEVNEWRAQPIGWNFATSGSSNVHIFNNQILANSDSNAFPFNTDGFSAGGTDLLFENNHVVNGDDCLTVGNGAKNIVFRNGYCEGGHGLSIGSLGEGGQVADVENVLIENVQMVDSLYAARFKSWTGGNGFARNVTWRNIAFTNVPFPVRPRPMPPARPLTSAPTDLHNAEVRPSTLAAWHFLYTRPAYSYWDQEDGPKPTPNGTAINNTCIEDFLFDGFAGSIEEYAPRPPLTAALADPRYILSKPYVEGSCVSDPCWYAVPGATGKEVAILALYAGSASNVVAKDVFAWTETGAPVRVMCNATTVTNDVGFKCWDGLFIPTKAGF